MNAPISATLMHAGVCGSLDRKDQLFIVFPVKNLTIQTGTTLALSPPANLTDHPPLRRHHRHSPDLGRMDGSNTENASRRNTKQLSHRIAKRWHGQPAREWRKRHPHRMRPKHRLLRRFRQINFIHRLPLCGFNQLKAFLRKHRKKLPARAHRNRLAFDHFRNLNLPVLRPRFQIPSL